MSHTHTPTHTHTNKHIYLCKSAQQEPLVRVCICIPKFDNSNVFWPVTCHSSEQQQQQQKQTTSSHFWRIYLLFAAIPFAVRRYPFQLCFAAERGSIDKMNFDLITCACALVLPGSCCSHICVFVEYAHTSLCRSVCVYLYVFIHIRGHNNCSAT